MTIAKVGDNQNEATLFFGDCAVLLKTLKDESVDLVISSPPYCIGKSYEDKTKAEEFLTDHEVILPEIVRVLKKGGSLCWQVGYHVKEKSITPLDFIVFQILARFPDIHLRNRIIWMFGHGLHSSDRFSGRHETILWFTKGDEYSFDLDAVRVPQKYPGKRHYKGDNKGEFSGHPLGKNPSDVWDIPNVKANHVEKTEHPCQFPIALAQRLIKALSKAGDTVLDPYAGSGTTGAAAIMLKRKFIGSEIDFKYYEVAHKRLKAAALGELSYRPDGKPVYNPPPNTPLTTVPKKWKNHSSHEKLPMHSAEAGKVRNSTSVSSRERTLRPS